MAGKLADLIISLPSQPQPHPPQTLYHTMRGCIGFDCVFQIFKSWWDGPRTFSARDVFKLWNLPMLELTKIQLRTTSWFRVALDLIWLQRMVGVTNCGSRRSLQGWESVCWGESPHFRLIHIGCFPFFFYCRLIDVSWFFSFPPYRLTNVRWFPSWKSKSVYV